MDIETMEKSAEFESAVMEVIKKRRSRRAYENRPVEPEKIESLFEAARWAPSSVNEQPWIYLYATKDQPALWQKIFDALNDGNKVWAKHAPLLIVSMVRKRFLRDDLPNRSAHYDVGAANAFLSLQATVLGLNVHQLGGFHEGTLVENLSVPEDYEPVTVIAVGYPGEADMLPEHLKARELLPRMRYVQRAFVMNGEFP